MSWGRFGLLLLGATIATLSAFQRLLVWPAVVPVLLVRTQRADRGGRAGRDWRTLILWLGATLDVWLVYFAGFDFRSSGLGGVTLRAVVSYVTAYLGAPVGSPDAARSEAFGLVGMLLLPALCLVYLLLGGRLRQLLPWACLALFVVLCSAATLTGRICGGAPSAITSRYQIFSALWWVALLVVAGLATEAVLHPLLHQPLHAQLQAQPVQSWNPWQAVPMAAANTVRLWVAQHHYRRLAVLSVAILAVLALCDGLVMASWWPMSQVSSTVCSRWTGSTSTRTPLCMPQPPPRIVC